MNGVMNILFMNDRFITFPMNRRSHNVNVNFRYKNTVCDPVTERSPETEQTLAICAKLELLACNLYNV